MVTVVGGAAPLWTASVFCPSALPSDTVTLQNTDGSPGPVTTRAENVDCPSRPGPVCALVATDASFILSIPA